MQNQPQSRRKRERRHVWTTGCSFYFMEEVIMERKLENWLINMYLEKMELYFKSKGILGHSVELTLLTSAMAQPEGQCTSQNLEADKQEQHVLIQSDTHQGQANKQA